MMTSLKVGEVCRSLCRSGGHHWLSSRHGVILASTKKNSELLLFPSPLACLVGAPQGRQMAMFPQKNHHFKPNHQKDGVSPDMKLIYGNHMNMYYTMGRLFLNGLALPIYGQCCYVLLSPQAFSFVSQLEVSGFITLYTVLLFAINYFCRRNLRRIYADKSDEKYVAVVQDWKLSTKTIPFNLSMAKRRTENKPGFDTFFGNVQIKGRPFLVSPGDFILPRYYNLLMGYDLKRPTSLDVITDIDIGNMQPKSRKKTEESSK